jgi:hypothetical protein
VLDLVVQAAHDLRKAQPLVAAYCAAEGVPYTQTTIWQAYRTIIGYLNTVGLAGKTPSSARWSHNAAHSEPTRAGPKHLKWFGSWRKPLPCLDNPLPSPGAVATRPLVLVRAVSWDRCMRSWARTWHIGGSPQFRWTYSPSPVSWGTLYG